MLEDPVEGALLRISSELLCDEGPEAILGLVYAEGADEEHVCRGRGPQHRLQELLGVLGPRVRDHEVHLLRCIPVHNEGIT